MSEENPLDFVEPAVSILDGVTPDFGVRRALVGMKVFDTAEQFEQWQRDAPREIYEVTPKAVIVPNNGWPSTVTHVIFVTYNAGIISS